MANLSASSAEVSKNMISCSCFCFFMNMAVHDQNKNLKTEPKKRNKKQNQTDLRKARPFQESDFSTLVSVRYERFALVTFFSFFPPRFPNPSNNLNPQPRTINEPRKKIGKAVEFQLFWNSKVIKLRPRLQTQVVRAR